jgi:hypothetical protein
MNYAILKNTWICKPTEPEITEGYEPKVTMSLSEWGDYIGDGKNVLYGSAVIPNGSVNNGVENGAVYKGTVGQVSGVSGRGGCSCRGIF